MRFRAKKIGVLLLTGGAVSLFLGSTYSGTSTQNSTLRAFEAASMLTATKTEIIITLFHLLGALLIIIGLAILLWSAMRETR
jgi:hypothetical protein